MDIILVIKLKIYTVCHVKATTFQSFYFSFKHLLLKKKVKKSEYII